MSQHRSRVRRALAIGGAVALAAPLVALSTPSAGATTSDYPQLHRYRITVANLTGGQPLSPLVASTHSSDVDLFAVGELASPEIATIAQAGDQSGAAALLRSLRGNGVTRVVEGTPVGPLAAPDGPFPTSQTLGIAGAEGDVLSLATMLICTNDGFTGLDSVALPESGTTVFPLTAYDAGVERNTERSKHIVDACSALGPVALAGDPNGNIDGRPAANRTPRPISVHQGVRGTRDLLPAHDWDGAVAVALVTLVR